MFGKYFRNPFIRTCFIIEYLFHDCLHFKTERLFYAKGLTSYVNAV